MGANRKTRGTAIGFGSKNWHSEAIGLFYTDDGHRIDDSFDLDTWAWVKEAACTGTNPEAWFDGYSDVARLAHICGTCPVRTECLDYALAHRETGFWGGLTETERKHLLADQPPAKENHDEV